MSLLIYSGPLPFLTLMAATFTQCLAVWLCTGQGMGFGVTQTRVETPGLPMNAVIYGPLCVYLSALSSFVSSLPPSIHHPSIHPPFINTCYVSHSVLDPKGTMIKKGHSLTWRNSPFSDEDKYHGGDYSDRAKFRDP